MVKIIHAIDFGIHAVGYGVALALDNHGEVPRAFTQWNSGMISTKGPTIMLLDHTRSYPTM